MFYQEPKKLIRLLSMKYRIDVVCALVSLIGLSVGIWAHMHLDFFLWGVMIGYFLILGVQSTYNLLKIYRHNKEIKKHFTTVIVTCPTCKTTQAAILLCEFKAHTCEQCGSRISFFGWEE